MLNNEQKVLRKVKKNPKISAPKIAFKLENETGKKVNNETVRRDIRRYGYNGRVVRKKLYVKQIERSVCNSQRST